MAHIHTRRHNNHLLRVGLIQEAQLGQLSQGSDDDPLRAPEHLPLTIEPIRPLPL